jgi:hypothetical protein
MTNVGMRFISFQKQCEQEGSQGQLRDPRFPAKL